MPLAPCPACRNRVSTEAATCPKCGHPLTPDLWQRKKPEGPSDRNTNIAIVLIVALFCGFYALPFLFGGSAQPTSGLVSGAQPPVDVPALDKMEAVFQGGYSKEQIEPVLRRALKMFGSPINDTEMMRFGSVLVTMRKENNVEEMEILRCVLAMAPQGMDFPSAAALCVVTLHN